MIELGQEVTFIPHWNKSFFDSPAEKREKAVTGTVIYVNHQNSYFTAEYTRGGATHRESFKFCDIGSEIHIVRGGKHGR